MSRGRAILWLSRETSQMCKTEKGMRPPFLCFLTQAGVAVRASEQQAQKPARNLRLPAKCAHSWGLKHHLQAPHQAVCVDNTPTGSHTMGLAGLELTM